MSPGAPPVERKEGGLKIVRTEDSGTLRSGRGFYETVYRPRRDELAEKWIRSN